MAYRSRICFTNQQKSEIWDRWQRGESMSSIGRSFDWNSSFIHPLIARAGGFRPAERKRSRFALTLAEREEISRGLGVGASLRQIACGLRRAPSTISREVHRNGGRDKYRAARSEGSAWNRALRPKLCKLACNQDLCRTVSTLLRRQWSPEQIAGCLKKRFPRDETSRVSHETIYKGLFVQARGVLKKELMAHLQSPRSMRRPLHSSLKSSGLGHIKDMVSIHDLRRIAVRGLWLGGVGLERRNEVVGEEVRLRWRPARRVGQRWMLASSVRSTPWSSRVAVTSVRVSVSHGSSAAIASSGLASACASIAASWPSGVVQAASSSLTAARIAVRRAG